MGGATFIKESKEAHQKQIFAKVVNGRICNVHTNNDTTLIGFQEWFKVKAIGRHLIFDKDGSNRALSAAHTEKAVIKEDGTFFLENYDISSFCKGHLFYRSCLEQILETVEFDF